MNIYDFRQTRYINGKIINSSPIITKNALYDYCHIVTLLGYKELLCRGTYTSRLYGTRMSPACVCLGFSCSQKRKECSDVSAVINPKALLYTTIQIEENRDNCLIAPANINDFIGNNHAELYNQILNGTSYLSQILRKTIELIRLEKEN